MLSWSNEGDIQVQMSNAYWDDGSETGERSGLVRRWPPKSRLRSLSGEDENDDDDGGNDNKATAANVLTASQALL